MDWVSLFQGCEDEVMLKSNELSHYSCTRLLRKMEAAGSGSDEEMEAEMVGVDDGELVSIPGSWLDSGNKHEEDNGLLENLYILPELKSSESVVVNCNGEGDDLGLENGNKSKWGRSRWRRDHAGGQRMGERSWKKLKRGRKCTI
jgi:hypothetical protein